MMRSQVPSLQQKGFIMNTKKLFPGVTQEDIVNKERQAELAAEQARLAEEAAAKKAEAERIARVQAEAKQQEEAARTAARRKYAMPYNTYIEPDNTVWKAFGILGVVMTAFYLICGSAHKGEIKYYEDWWLNQASEAKKAQKKYKWYNTLYHAWNPVSDGFYGYWEDDPYGQDIGRFYIGFDKDSIGKFKPTGTWYFNIVSFLTMLSIAIGVSIDQKKRINETKQENKLNIKAVDMMLDLQKLGKEYNLNTEQVQKLVSLTPQIISDMSRDERVYFDMLMNGDIEIAENKTFLGMATAIMDGHLKKHPEDMQRVLEVFDEKSIPESLIQKYASKTR